ncbi:MAG: hypothetical protein ACYTBJ_06710 [Planctomycetota bacterium]|jgi:hypothetical protein
MQPDWRVQEGEEGPDPRAQAAAAAPAAATPLAIPPGATMPVNFGPAWSDGNPLTSGESRYVNCGLPGSGQTIIDMTGIKYITWQMISEFNYRLTIQGSNDLAFGSPDVIILDLGTAGNIITPYSLSAPLNRTGYIILTRPFIRILIEDRATANHTYTRIFAKSWV